MRAAIFLWTSLFLIGSVSISNCYRNNNEKDDDEMSMNAYNVRSNSLDKLLRSLSKSRSYKVDESLDSNEEETRNMKFQDRACTSGCTPACKADQLCIAPNQCVCPNGQSISPCPIQHSGLCAPADTVDVKPALLITFGEGESKYSKATPASLGFKTSYKQVSGEIHDGSFAIMNESPSDYAEWINGGLDHTEGCHAGKSKGYMMVFGANAVKNEIATMTVDKLCIGLRYQFSIYVANIVRAGIDMIKPDLEFEVHTSTGNKIELASKSTGEMPEHKTLTWIQYGMSFIPPTSSVVITINSISLGGRGNDFAIDDISLVSCSPGSSGVCS